MPAGSIGPESFEPAVAAGLLRVEQSRVRFRHPLVRSAIQHAATQTERRQSHAALASTLVDQPVRGVPAALASLTKGGLDAVTRSLAIEYADKGIRVNAVAPGIIKTPMHPPETHSFLVRLHPLGRMGEIREVVDAVLYLESAAFVTGETIHVDGGAHAGHW